MVGAVATWGARTALAPAQIDAYLARIGLDSAAVRQRPSDLALLADLQLQHLRSSQSDASR